MSLFKDEYEQIIKAQEEVIAAQLGRIAIARAALARIWPDGETCQHADAREAFKALAAVAQGGAG